MKKPKQTAIHRMYCTRSPGLERRGKLCTNWYWFVFYSPTQGRMMLQIPIGWTLKGIRRLHKRNGKIHKGETK